MPRESLSFFLILFTVIVFSACKKDDNTEDMHTPKIENPMDYTQYKVGNYWIYQIKHCDSVGQNCTVSSNQDSIFVTKDTMIDGEKYYKIDIDHIGNSYSVFRRDSAHFIVNEKGEKQFSTNNYTEVFHEFAYTTPFNNDTLYFQTNQMDSIKHQVSVPAGNFECLTVLSKVYRKDDGFEIARPVYTHHAKGVGIVKTIGFSLYSLSQVQRELIEYKVD